MIDVVFFALNIPGKAPDSIINGNDIRVKTTNQIIQRIKR